MKHANKPLLDRFFDRGVSNELGLPIEFQHNVPKKDVQTFILSPEVALSAEMLVRSKSFKMPTLDELHMPYPHTVIEYPLTEDIRKLRHNGTINGLIEITRVGAYIQEINKGVFTCMPYWEFIDGRIEHSFFTFLFGVGKGPALKISFSPNVNGEGAVDCGLAPCMAFIMAAEKAGVTPDQLKRVYEAPEAQQHIREAASEIPCLMFASYLLLNCKSGVGRTKVPARVPPKGMKLGGRKQKAYSASSYTLLHLEEIESVTTEGAISRRLDISAHYVRGHFKQRRSGVYWWNSFVRGNGEPRKREAYLVKETGDNDVEIHLD
jgi:hypothetical protein